MYLSFSYCYKRLIVLSTCGQQSAKSAPFRNSNKLTHNETLVLFPIKKSGTAGRVAVTGAGLVSALGIGWRANAEGFRAGRVAFGPVTLFDVSRQRAKTAAEVRLPDEFPKTRLSPRQEQRLDRASRLLLLATYEAW